MKGLDSRKLKPPILDFDENLVDPVISKSSTPFKYDAEKEREREEQMEWEHENDQPRYKKQEPK